MKTTAALLLLAGLAAAFPGRKTSYNRGSNSGYARDATQYTLPIKGSSSYKAPTTSYKAPTSNTATTSYKATSAVHAGDQHSSHDNCVEISRYEDVQYTESNVEVCTHSTRRQCQPRTEQLCQAVPVKRCELVGRTQCQDSASTVSRQEGVTTQEFFTPQVCQRGADAQLFETKEKPVCKTVTKQQCDSRWEVDPATGEKVWAGNINCRNVDWEDCSLVETQVATAVEQYDCHAGAAISYNVVGQQSVQHNIGQQVCNPSAELVCSEQSESQCVTVEWEDCQDELVPNCDTVWMNKPSQQKTISSAAIRATNFSIYN